MTHRPLVTNLILFDLNFLLNLIVDPFAATFRDEGLSDDYFYPFRPNMRVTKCTESTKVTVSLHQRNQLPKAATHTLIQDTDDPSSDSEHSAASTSPLEDCAMRGEVAQGQNVSNFCEESKASPASVRLPYVALDPEAMKWLPWSNDPANLYLSVYFNATVPNLSAEFNVGGLRPVVKEDDSDMFILQDAKNYFYFWEAWDGRLLRVKDTWTEGFDSNEEIIENLIIYQSFVERDAVVVDNDRKEDSRRTK
ncbi:uncharacterized protein K460DRAFT_359473 [Cucurbitaria berberidis CBS 394.84]|uniref:Uncharacterized protein n=1 Tax=Cucurbitaria berberidis CBS 394.84 TaxID=1168544 RepID=A0A9P4G8E3_9PLEO|nr:uncharacterized protein K460DRAFT_359473 [Cucurbitaria berberidis CBS 394.84]KAF1840930.1 hypothetical protein K460DRAFT_359473 [Cucurbitaria berberidis CBS 394.84]